MDIYIPPTALPAFAQPGYSSGLPMKREASKKEIQQQKMELSPLPFFPDMLPKTDSRELIKRIAKINETRDSENSIDEFHEKKKEFYIEELVKKYLYFFQDGFRESLEGILEEIIDEDDKLNEGKKVYFPGKAGSDIKR